MRFEQEKFAARQIDVGKTEIDLRFELGVGQRLNFVDERLPGAHGLFGHGDESLGFQRVVEGLIDDQKNVGASGCGILVLGLGSEFGAGEQIGGAAEVGDKLADASLRQPRAGKQWDC